MEQDAERKMKGDRARKKRGCARGQRKIEKKGTGER